MDLEAVAQELYAVPLEQFTPLRTQREKEARAAGDRELAAQVKALRKPAVGAWLANQLVRRHRDEVEPLLELGASLREAQATLQGDELRQLSAQRHRLVAALVRRAGAIAAESGMRMSADTERTIEQTLEAGLADPAAAEELLEARLVAPLEYVGFGGAMTVQPARALRVVPSPEPSTGPAKSEAPQRTREKPDEAAARRARREEERRERERREREEREHAVRQAQAALDEARAADERTAAEEAAAQERARAHAERLEELRGEVVQAEERAAISRRHAAEAREAHKRAAADRRVAERRLDAAKARLSDS